jgi:uncharacterized phage protein (TIGR01671 family)
VREIKFRAWDKVLKTIVMDFFIYADGDIHNDTGWDDRHAGCKVNERLVLMQYTGLKDKNGKEIYEGDIVRYQKDARFSTDDGKTTSHSIVFAGGAFCMLRNVWPTGQSPFYLSGYYEEIEVIGNIYENPDLLTK